MGNILGIGFMGQNKAKVKSTILPFVFELAAVCFLYKVINISPKLTYTKLIVDMFLSYVKTYSPIIEKRKLYKSIIIFKMVTTTNFKILITKKRKILAKTYNIHSF